MNKSDEGGGGEGGVLRYCPDTVCVGMPTLTDGFEEQDGENVL